MERQTSPAANLSPVRGRSKEPGDPIEFDRTTSPAMESEGRSPTKGIRERMEQLNEESKDVPKHWLVESNAWSGAVTFIVCLNTVQIGVASDYRQYADT